MQGMLDSPRACIKTLQTKASGSLVMKLFEAKAFCIKETSNLKNVPNFSLLITNKHKNVESIHQNSKKSLEICRKPVPKL